MVMPCWKLEQVIEGVFTPWKLAKLQVMVFFFPLFGDQLVSISQHTTDLALFQRSFQKGGWHVREETKASVMESDWRTWRFIPVLTFYDSLMLVITLNGYTARGEFSSEKPAFKGISPQFPHSETGSHFSVIQSLDESCRGFFPVMPPIWIPVRQLRALDRIINHCPSVLHLILCSSKI